MPIINVSNEQAALVSAANALGKLYFPDVFAATLLHMGFLDVEISDTAPTDTSKIWFDPNDPATDAPGVCKAHNGTSWVTCTPALLSAHIATKAGAAITSETNTFTKPQKGDIADPVNTGASLSISHDGKPRRQYTVDQTFNFDVITDQQIGAELVVTFTIGSGGPYSASYHSSFNFVTGTPFDMSTLAVSEKVTFYMDCEAADKYNVIAVEAQ